MPSKRSPKVPPGPAETPAPFHDSYQPLILGLPDSVIQKVTSRAEMRGLDLAELGEGTRHTYHQVRALVPMLDEDRPLGPDIDRIQRAVTEGVFKL